MFAMPLVLAPIVLGGYAFGLVYMVTEPVSAAHTNMGRYMVRRPDRRHVRADPRGQPAFPEGMMLAILFGNVFAPLIDHFVVQRQYYGGGGKTSCLTRHPFKGGPKGFIGKFLSEPTIPRRRSSSVAVALCLVCLHLRFRRSYRAPPAAGANKQLKDMRNNILQVAGLMQEGAEIDELFEAFSASSLTYRGPQKPAQFTDAVDVGDLRCQACLRSRGTRSRARPFAPGRPGHRLRDQAPRPTTRPSIWSRAMTTRRYRHGDHPRAWLRPLVDPLRLSRSWKPNGDEIVGLQFYDHAETPGLGGEVDNPNWRAKWQRQGCSTAMTAISKIAAWSPRSVPAEGPMRPFRSTALAGATLTSVGRR